MTVEEDRAAEHRRVLLAREAAAKLREKQLAGDATRRKALEDAWEPVREWLAERREDRGGPAH